MVLAGRLRVGTNIGLCVDTVALCSFKCLFYRFGVHFLGAWGLVV